MPLALPPREAKPRRKGITAMIDFGPDSFGWTGPNGVADLLGAAAGYIDYAKIYALNALLLPDAFTRDVVGLYRDADIVAYAGGILFEHAYRQRATDEIAPLLRRLGIPALEISENYVTLDDDERRRFIDSFDKDGFQVIYEFGRKQPDAPFALDALRALVKDAMEAGAHHVIVEQSEIDALVAANPNALRELAALDWFEHLLIEADPYRFPQQHAELLRAFGPDVNLANIAPGQCLRLEGLRRGIGRAVNYGILDESRSPDAG